METRTILVATDFSAPAARALATAADLAARLDAEVLVVHVLERLIDAVPSVGGLTDAERAAEAALNEPAERRLEAWTREHVPAGLPVRTELREGDPVREIIAIATDVGADIIVMGVHGRSAIERFFLGSVTEAVLRRAPCPVLAVPAA